MTDRVQAGEGVLQPMGAASRPTRMTADGGFLFLNRDSGLQIYDAVSANYETPRQTIDLLLHGAARAPEEKS